MTKLEAWKAWCESAGTTDLATEFTLEQSSHGKAFSFGWDEAAKAERKRLAPVMADAPIRTAPSELAPLASPLGLSINQYRQQTTAVIDDLAHIIESLEI